MRPERIRPAARRVCSPRDEVQRPALVVRRPISRRSRAPSPSSGTDLVSVITLCRRSIVVVRFASLSPSVVSRAGPLPAGRLLSSVRPAIARSGSGTRTRARAVPRRGISRASVQRGLRMMEGLLEREDPASGQAVLEEMPPPAPRPSSSGTWPRRSPPAGPRCSRPRLAGREGGVVGELGPAHGRAEVLPELVGDPCRKPTAVARGVDRRTGRAPLPPARGSGLKSTPRSSAWGTRYACSAIWMSSSERSVCRDGRPRRTSRSEASTAMAPYRPPARPPDGMAPADRRVVLISVAGDAHRAAERLQRDVVGGRLGPRAGRAETRRGARHDPGLDPRQVVARDARGAPSHQAGSCRRRRGRRRPARGRPIGRAPP